MCIYEGLMKQDSVFLHIWNASEWYGREQELLSKIAPSYQKKYAQAGTEEEKYQELGAGYLLYKYLGVQRDEQLIYNSYGKPSLKNGAIDFNLSHSKNYVVLAVSKESVGVDIEHIEQIPVMALKRVLSSSQLKNLEKIDGMKKDQAVEYGKSWTRVEAILKGFGTGFFTDPRQFPEYYKGWYCESREYENDYVITCARKTPFVLIIK